MFYILHIIIMKLYNVLDKLDENDFNDIRNSMLLYLKYVL